MNGGKIFLSTLAFSFFVSHIYIFCGSVGNGRSTKEEEEAVKKDKVLY
jgi:hypothetical protein